MTMCGHYCATKSALTMLAKTLALEEAANRVKVNVVSPDAIMSEIVTKQAFQGITEEQAKKILEKIQPLPRTGMPGDIGSAVAFLAREDRARFATGTELVFDGGSLIAPISAVPDM